MILMTVIIIIIIIDLGLIVLTSTLLGVTAMMYGWSYAVVEGTIKILLLVLVLLLLLILIILFFAFGVYYKEKPLDDFK